MMDKREKSILSIVQERGPIRFNELKRVACKELSEDKRMSDRPFREILKKMVSSGLIIRTPVDSQNVVYSLTSMPSQQEIEKIVQNVTKFEEEYDDLKIQMKTLPFSEKAEKIIISLKILSNLELQYLLLYHVLHNSKLNKVGQKLSQIKKEIISLLKNDSDESELFLFFVYMILSGEYLKMRTDPESSYLGVIKHNYQKQNPRKK